MAQSRNAKKAVDVLLHDLLARLSDEQLASLIRELSVCADVLSTPKQRRIVLDALAVSLKGGATEEALLSTVKDASCREVLALALRRRALDVLPHALERSRRAFEERGLGRFAVIESAVALEPSERARLAEDLAKRWNMPAELEEQTNPALLGGYRIRSRDWTLDASVLGRLKRLASAFQS